MLVFAKPLHLRTAACNVSILQLLRRLSLAVGCREDFERVLAGQRFAFSLLVHTDVGSPMIDFLDASSVLQVYSLNSCSAAWGCTRVQTCFTCLAREHVWNSMSTCSLCQSMEHMSEGACNDNALVKIAEWELCGVRTSGARRLPAVSAPGFPGWKCSHCCQQCCQGGCQHHGNRARAS